MRDVYCYYGPSGNAWHCFRDMLMTLDRLCRYSLSLAFCAENAALALPAAKELFNIFCNTAYRIFSLT